MGGAIHNWESPSSRLVLNAVLDALADLGYEGLTAVEVRTRAGAAGRALGDAPDLDSLVVTALRYVQLFSPVIATGDLRRDLRTLLEPWRRAPSRDERVLAAVLSPAVRNPRLKCAVHHVLDRPLTRTVGSVVSRAAALDQVPPHLIHTVCWVLRGLILDRLRSGPRLPVDLDLLVEFLVAGSQASQRPPALGRQPSPGAEPTETTT